MKKHIKNFLLVSMIVLLTACGNAKLKDPKEVVFEINNKSLKADEYYKLLKDHNGIEILITKMDEMLLDKLYPLTKDEEREIEEQIEMYREQLGDKLEEQIKMYYGLNSVKEFKNLMRMNVKKYNVTAEYAAGTITDKDIEKYYNEKTIGDIKASHILIKPKTEENMTEEEITAAENTAKELAKEIIKKLDNNESFENLAKQYSQDDGNKDKGGDLDYFNRKKMVEEFTEAAIKLEINEYSKEPVKTTFGYHIILKTDQKEKPKLKDEKDNIKAILTEDKLANTSNILPYAMENLRTKYKLKIHDSQMKTLYENYMTNEKNQ